VGEARDSLSRLILSSSGHGRCGLEMESGSSLGFDHAGLQREAEESWTENEIWTNRKVILSTAPDGVEGLATANHRVAESEIWSRMVIAWWKLTETASSYAHGPALVTLTRTVCDR
jgi:hypothetical protein